MISKIKPLSDPQRRLMEKLPTGEWVDVPHPTRAGTVLALVRRGLIKHRYKQPWYPGDWVTWGEVHKL